MPVAAPTPYADSIRRRADEAERLQQYRRAEALRAEAKRVAEFEHLFD